MDEQSIQNEVILGVDTHLDVNVGAVISHTGKLLGTLATSTSAKGYIGLLNGHAHSVVFDEPVSKVRELMGPALPASCAGKELMYSKSIVRTAASAG